MAGPQTRLLTRGLRLEYVTLGWNVVGVVVVAIAALTARSVALAGFGLDSLIEIFASVVVVWELTGAASDQRQRRALRLIGTAFFSLTAYITGQAAYVLVTQSHPRSSPLGIGWTACHLCRHARPRRWEGRHRQGSRQPGAPD